MDTQHGRSFVTVAPWFPSAFEVWEVVGGVVVVTRCFSSSAHTKHKRGEFVMPPRCAWDVIERVETRHPSIDSAMASTRADGCPVIPYSE
jgi:hypothetical protein